MNGTTGPVGRNAAPHIPNVKPTVTDDKVADTNVSPMNLARVGIIAAI
jgi:hypothetical protein